MYWWCIQLFLDCEHDRTWRSVSLLLQTVRFNSIYCVICNKFCVASLHEQAFLQNFPLPLSVDLHLLFILLCGKWEEIMTMEQCVFCLSYNAQDVYLPMSFVKMLTFSFFVRELTLIVIDSRDLFFCHFCHNLSMICGVCQCQIIVTWLKEYSCCYGQYLKVQRHCNSLIWTDFKSTLEEAAN